jgi:hypothetical protein
MVCYEYSFYPGSKTPSVGHQILRFCYLIQVYGSFGSEGLLLTRLSCQMPARLSSHLNMTLHNGSVDMTGLRQTLLSVKDNLPAPYHSTHMPIQWAGIVISRPCLSLFMFFVPAWFEFRRIPRDLHR